MSRGINKVILIGHLGKDPEAKQFSDGTALCNISLATSDVWKDKATGETKQSTEWHRLVATNRLAEIAATYLKKGAKVYVEGKLRTKKWQNQLGHQQYTTEIRVTELQMLDAKQSDQYSPGNPKKGEEKAGYEETKSIAPVRIDSSLIDDVPF